MGSDWYGTIVEVRSPRDSRWEALRVRWEGLDSDEEADCVNLWEVQPDDRRWAAVLASMPRMPSRPLPAQLRALGLKVPLCRAGMWGHAGWLILGACSIASCLAVMASMLLWCEACTEPGSALHALGSGQEETVAASSTGCAC